MLGKTPEFWWWLFLGLLNSSFGFPLFLFVGCGSVSTQKCGRSKVCAAVCRAVNGSSCSWTGITWTRGDTWMEEVAKMGQTSVGFEGSSIDLVCCALGGLFHLLIQPENLKSNPLAGWFFPPFWCLNILMNLMWHPGQTSPNTQLSQSSWRLSW